MSTKTPKVPGPAPTETIVVPPVATEPPISTETPIETSATTEPSQTTTIGARKGVPTEKGRPIEEEVTSTVESTSTSATNSPTNKLGNASSDGISSGLILGIFGFIALAVLVVGIYMIIVRRGRKSTEQMKISELLDTQAPKHGSPKNSPIKTSPLPNFYAQEPYTQKPYNQDPYAQVSYANDYAQDGYNGQDPGYYDQYQEYSVPQEAYYDQHNHLYTAEEEQAYYDQVQYYDSQYDPHYLPPTAPVGGAYPIDPRRETIMSIDSEGFGRGTLKSTDSEAKRRFSNLAKNDYKSNLMSERKPRMSMGSEDYVSSPVSIGSEFPILSLESTSGVVKPESTEEKITSSERDDNK
jgi:hypothetical protein